MANRIRNLTLTVANILMIFSVGIDFGCTTYADNTTTRLSATTVTRTKSTTNTPSTSKSSTTTKSNTSTSISTTTTSKSPTSSTVSTTITTIPRPASTSSAATILSVAYPSSSTTGGLSDGGKIGIGFGIGVGVTLVLVGIIFIVLCRRYDWTKRTKTDDEITKGKTDDSGRNKRDILETSHYQQLQNLSMNPGPTYEQLTPPTDVDITEQSLSGRTTYEDIGHKLKANERDSIEYEYIQQRELPASDAYERIQQMS